MGGAVDASFKLALVFKFVKFMRYYVKVIAGKKKHGRYVVLADTGLPR